MNKSELALELSSKADMSVAAATRVLDALMETITDALKAGDQVTLVGFGTFLSKERAARIGRNPQNGKAIEISAAKVPTFKPGKNLRDALNG